MKDYYNILNKCILFKNFNENDLKSILNCLDTKVKNYSKNDIVILAGSKVDTIGIVLSGNLQITKEDYDGNRIIVSSIEKSEIFAEALVCANIDKSPITVISSDKSSVLYISLKNILGVCSESCTFHIKLISNLLNVIAKKNVILNEKIEILSKKTIEEKLISYLTNQMNLHGKNTFTIPFNRNELADFLGVNRSSLSRELSNMQENGMLEFKKNTFTIYT